MARPDAAADDGNSSASLPRLGLILLVLVTLSWGLAWPAMKIVLNEMSAWTFRTVTIPAGALVLLAVTRMSGLSLAVPKGRWPALIIVGTINVGGWQMLSALGLAELTSGRAVLVAYTMPVWTSLFSALILGEALTGRIVAALMLGMAGVGLLLWGDLGSMGAEPLGVAFMIAAALSWGLGIVLLKRTVWGMPVLSLATWQLIVAAVPIVILSWALDGIAFAPLSGLGWVMLIFVILVPIAFCNWAFFKVVSLFPANVSAIGTLMIPVIGVTSGALVLGEPVGWPELAALLLIGSAMVLTLLFPARRR